MALLLPLIFVVVPALGLGMRRSLRVDEGRGVDRSRASRRQQRALAMIQVSAALMLLVVAGLVVRSFVATLVADFGLNQGNLLNVSLTLPSWEFRDPLDPATYAICGFFLLLACGVALWAPARRASRVGARLADLLR